MSYTPTTWSTGDTITATLANHWETQYENVEELQLNGTNYPGSLSATANTVAVRDANGNVVSNLPVTSGMNPNLLFNPTFALGSAGWIGLDTPFKPYFGTYGEGSMLTNNEGPYSSGSGTLGVRSGNIPMSANQVLSLSAEITTSGLTAGNFEVQVNAYDSTGTFLEQAAIAVSSVAGWKKYSMPFTTPASTSYVMIYVYMPANSSASQFGVAVRKIKLEAGSVATTFTDDNTFNILQYGSLIPFTGSQIFTESGTFIVPEGKDWIKFRGWGGGQGGDLYGTGYTGRGGGGGDYAEGWIPVSAGQSIAITVGQGGTGTPQSGSGTAATASQIGSYITINPGTPAGIYSPNPAGVEEVTTDGFTHVKRQYGGQVSGDQGATSSGGTGGAAGNATTQAGNATSPGGGGGGYSATQTTWPAGNGAPGRVELYW